jgi:hypothetical protein|tara:strand:- start:656 stop:871 length:216 start_codon:yes stop_codon:yes gene_type:complete
MRDTRDTIIETEKAINETRLDIAEVEGTLNFVIAEVGNEWCTTEDVKRILTEQKAILETLRLELKVKKVTF